MSERKSGLGSFLGELKRRHVWRAAIAYAAATFVILQAAEIVLPAFDAPDWILRVTVVVTLLGFPVVLALAWVYEITPQGIRRTREAEADPSPSGRTRDVWPRVVFLAVVVLTVGGVGWWTVRWTVGPDVIESSAAGSAGERPVGAESRAPIRSLAVLPLQDFSESGEQDYFSAGMHEALIAQLGQLSSLRVVSRTSVMQYAGTTKDMPTIARELNVEGIVEGSVTRADDRVRITVQLIHGPSDSHIWTRSYEREFANIIALQNEVAQAIARELEAELTPEETTRLARAGPVDPEAHEAYLRGRFEQSKGTPEALASAIQHYQQALEEDSSYAPAYTGLASAQLMLEVADEEGSRSLLDDALQSALSAVRLDRNSPEARAILAEVERQLKASRGLVELKVVLDSVRLGVPLDSLDVPNAEWVVGMTELGRQLALSGLHTLGGNAPGIGSIDHRDRLIAVARHLGASGQHQEATRILEGLLQTEPQLTAAWDALEYLHAVRGDYPGAVAVRRRRVEAIGDSEDRREVAALERRVAQEGTEGYWVWRRDHLSEREREGEPISHVAYAAACVALGLEDEALDRLEAAYQAGEPALATLQVDPTWDPLRRDPRFRELIRKVRQPPAAPALPPAR